MLTHQASPNLTLLYQRFRHKRAETLYCPKKKTNLCKRKQAKMLHCPKKTKKKPKKEQSLETSRPWRSPSSPNFGFFGFFGTAQHFCTYYSKKIGLFGTVQHFGGLGLQKTVLSQKNNLCKRKQAKMLYCPKKTKKKPKFGDPKLSKLWFFWVFLGQYSIFALFTLKRLVVLGQYSTLEAWDCKNAALSTVPKKNIF